MVEVVLRTFIPTEAIGVPYPSNFVNGADNRGFNTLNGSASSRTTQIAYVDLVEPIVEKEPEVKTGETLLYNKNDTSPTSLWWARDLDEDAEIVDRDKLDEATIEKPTITPTGENSYSINFDLKATNPIPPPPVDALTADEEYYTPAPIPDGKYVKTPAIDADITVEISRDEVRPYVYETSYEVSGTHDGFPAYELYIDYNLVYAYDPILAGKDPVALFPTPEATSDVDIADGTSGLIRGNRYRGDAEPGTAVGSTTGGFDTIAPTGSSIPFGRIVGEYTDSLLFDAFRATSSSLSFSGDDFQAKPDEAFVLGELTYKNDVNGSNSNEEFSGIYTTDLTIFTDSPISSNQGNFNDVLIEQINLNITQDTFGEVRQQNPDIISFPDNPEFGSFHVYEGKKGTVELLGEFDNDGNLSFAGFGEVLAETTGFLS